MSGPDERLRALVVEHERPTPAGLVDLWLDERGADVDLLRIDVEEREVDPRDYSLVVSLGSELAAYDDSIPWIEREKRLLREAARADVPVLGICFGGQLLARVLGGDAYRAPVSEIGWLPVGSRDPGLLPEGPWFQWHFDTFAPPPGARLLAENEAGAQAFVVGRSLAVQFHPEVTPEIMDDWVRVYRHELDAEGVDPDGLLEETERLAGLTRQSSFRLFDSYLDRVACASAAI